MNSTVTGIRTVSLAVAVVLAALIGGVALVGAAAAAENIHDGSVTDPSTGEAVYAANTSEDKELTYGYVVENVTNSGDSVKIQVAFNDQFNVSSGRLNAPSFSGNVTCRCGGTPEDVGISDSPVAVDGDGDGIKETIQIGVQPNKRDKPIDLIVNLTGPVQWSEESRNVAYQVEGYVDDPNRSDAPPTSFETVQVAGGIYTETGETMGVSDTEATLNASHWDVPKDSKLQFTYWEKGDRSGTQRVTANRTVEGSGMVSETVSGLDPGTEYLYKVCIYNADTNESNDGPTLSYTTDSGTTSGTPTGTEGRCGNIDPVIIKGTETIGGGVPPTGDPPEISNYRVTSTGEEVTVSFDSDENLVEVEADVRGSDGDETLTREDFSGNRYEGFEATYEANSTGDYTVELLTATDSSNDDGARNEDFTGATMVESINDSSNATGGSAAGPPEIRNFTVTADGGEIVVSFDTDENLTAIEVRIGGSADATLRTEAFSGNRTDGYEATYDADADGTYTVELVAAEDADGNDGAAAEAYNSSATIETDDRTPTPDETTPEEDTPTDDSGGTPVDDMTESPTGDQPGFGPVVALVAVLGSALLCYRRR
jgi:PGF-CTERM protein